MTAKITRLIAIAALALSFAFPAFASTFTISGWTAQAGQHVRFTIGRVSGSTAVYVNFRTDDITAKARIDYAPVVGRVYFKQGQLTRTVSPATYINSAQLGHTLTFKGTVSFNGIIQSSAGAFIVEPADTASLPPATQTCADNTVILATSVCPTPQPPPVATGWLTSPSLDGLPATTAPDFVLSDAIQSMSGTGAIPPSAAPDNVGAFRFICKPGQVLPDDPIVYPGQPGKSHGHQFYGNESVDAFTDYTGLRTKGTSTCQRGVLSPGNRSGYWMPDMLDAAGSPVKPAYVSIYYKRRPASDPKCNKDPGTWVGPLSSDYAEGRCVPIPNALRFIFGYDMLTGKAPTGALWFNCQSPNPAAPIPGVVPGRYANLAVALQNCPVGALLGAVIEAPKCWDGKDLDSPNHRDHVAYEVYDYGNTGQPWCPATHPYVIPEFLLGAWFPVAAGMHLSCDAMLPPGTPPGVCFHADYFEGWDPTVKAMWTDHCINLMLNCSAGDLGNGKQLIGAAI